MLVGTYKDELKKKLKDQLKRNPEDSEVELKIQGLDSVLQAELKDILDTDLLRYAFDDQLIFDVDNMTGSEDEVEKMRNRLEEVIFQEFEELLIPASWFMFSIFLRRMKKDTVSLSQCEEIGRRLQKTQSGVHEAIWFLHHCIGILMHYPKVEKLKAVVICNPQIVFKSVTQLILHTFDMKHIHKRKCEEFKREGLFCFEDIEKLSEKFTAHMLSLPQLIELLEYLFIIAHVSSTDSSTKEHGVKAPKLASRVPVSEVYFMPAVLPSAQERELNVSRSSVDPSPLLIRFKSGIVPVGVFCACVASLVAQMKPKWTLRKPQESTTQGPGGRATSPLRVPDTQRSSRTPTHKSSKATSPRLGLKSSKLGIQKPGRAVSKPSTVRGTQQTGHVEPDPSRVYLCKNRVTFRVNKRSRKYRCSTCYDITLISKPKQYEIHIQLEDGDISSDSLIREICEHVLDTFCSTLNNVLSKMKHRKYLAPPSANSSSYYEVGFPCPLHPDEDHMAVCRPCDDLVDPSLSAAKLLSGFFENDMSLFFLDEDPPRIFDLKLPAETLSASVTSGAHDHHKDVVTNDPHFKCSLWMKPPTDEKAGGEFNQGLKKPQPQSNQPSSRPESPVHEKPSDKVVRHFKPATFSDAETSATAIWELADICDKIDGKGIVIAIIDNGVNSGHKAFKTAIADGRLFGFRSYPVEDKYTDEWSSPGGDKASHGTMAAFIAGGEAFGATKSGGVAPKSTLVNCSVGNTYNELAIINSLNKLIKWKESKPPHPKAPDIISMSFGLVYTPDDPNQTKMRSQIERLRELDVVIIAAAGNSGKMDGGVQFPACEPNVICVGAHGKEGYKQKTNAPEDIDVFAPGKHILHPAANGSDIRDCSSGSSCAAPAIAGLMALLLQFSEKYVKDVEKRKKFRQDVVFLKKTLFGEKLRKGGDTVLLKPLNFFEKEIAEHEKEIAENEAEQLKKEKEQLERELELLKRMQGHDS